MANSINESKKMVLTLKVSINVHCGEEEEDVFKHLSNILYDHDSDIEEVA